MHQYKIKEFIPKSGQPGTHSFYVEAKPFQTLSNAQMAAKIEARSGFKKSEAKAMLEILGEIIKEELAEGSAIQIADENEDVIVKFQAKAEYSVTDKDVEARTTEQHKKNAEVKVRTVATAEDIVAQDINWRVQAIVGVNFSKSASAVIRKAGTRKVGEVERTDTPAEVPGGDQPPMSME